MNSTTNSQGTKIPAPQPETPVMVERHQPNLEDPGPEVEDRIMLLPQPFPNCLYLNPIVTVTCDEATPEFFRTVRKQQGLWCCRCKTTYPRKARRSVKDWVNSSGAPRREERYLDRALCFIGLLFLNGSLIPPHKWPDRKSKAPNSRKVRASSRKEESRQQEKP
jgi:hypothetical protein